MLRPAAFDYLSVLREIRHATQSSLAKAGSLQVLGNVEDVDDYLLYSSDIFGNSLLGICRLSSHIPVHVQPCFLARPDLYLSSLIIHPRFQSLGLGRQMMKALQSLGKAMALDVWVENERLRRWYEELGWRFVVTVEETMEIRRMVQPFTSGHSHE
ncbi:hypothetical protein ACGC1H_000300 [Rhizoctonia solani]|uniref:N-acetyltransferase domain-containing protein n=1 Tax=Rhizoctonia solani TaxID=456999 RepID=A0A8H2WQG5_9AGAM|nr:unnamed protein product [Rhizoctonia solani]